jgi:hypothetical protein
MIPKISSEPIELETTASQPVTVKHGLGRQVAGYVVIWSTGPVQLYVQDPAADTSRELVLIPDATVRLRLVLL